MITQQELSLHTDKEYDFLKTQLSSTRGSLKRSQELYAHSMHEKSKVSTSENEYKKQLISMTSTIDNLAEDKELLMQKL